MATLRLEDVSKRFSRKVWGVRKIDLQVQDKEFIVLLGPSGCGKTTTLRMVAGLTEVTTGTIYIGDRDITELPPRKRGVSMVFQNYAVWPHMTVYDNIAFSLRLMRVSKQETDGTVRDVAEMVKISELLKRYPKQLSGGQQQRVALARALAVKPQIFLLDEPLSNLDAKLRVMMRTELKAIHQQTRATSVFVTHDQSEAMSMADRIVIMKDGEVVQTGTTDDVYFRSANVFVAGFIGTPPTNFFPVNIDSKSGRIVLHHPHFDLAVNGKNQSLLDSYEKNDLILGVRPEDILICPESQSLFTEEVLVVEPQGSHQIVAIKLEDQIVKIMAASTQRVHPGERIHLSFQPLGLHFFDSETEWRIGAN
jgi:multiple sugar transport system ATP-binding protein